MSERKEYFDYLRVFSALAVVVLHTSAQNWHGTDVHSYAWQVFNFGDSIVRWCVPVFVMISGALFLNRDIPLKKIYSKYIFRMVVSFFVWSVFYACFISGGLTSNFGAVVRGHYHMWYIQMIIGLYMCIPFIKPAAETRERTGYFLLLSLIFAFIFPESRQLIKDFGNDVMKNASNAIHTWPGNMAVQTVMGYAGYFVLGYYLDKAELSKQKRVVIYVLGLFGFMFTITADLAAALKIGKPCSHYYGNFNVNVMSESAAVFIFFRYREYKNLKLNTFMQKLSKYSFGAFLIHPFVLERLDSMFGINTLSFDPVLSVTGIAAIVFIVSFIVSWILNHIPFVNKYIV